MVFVSSLLEPLGPWLGFKGPMSTIAWTELEMSSQKVKEKGCFFVGKSLHLDVDSCVCEIWCNTSPTSL